MLISVRKITNSSACIMTSREKRTEEFGVLRLRKTLQLQSKIIKSLDVSTLNCICTLKYRNKHVLECVRRYAYMCVRSCFHVCACVRMCVCACVHVCVCVCVCVCVRACVLACVRACVYIFQF